MAGGLQEQRVFVSRDSSGSLAMKWFGDLRPERAITYAPTHTSWLGELAAILGQALELWLAHPRGNLISGAADVFSAPVIA